MTLTEARKILGLGPDEDPRPHLAEFRLAREKIAEMVRNAPNETLGDRYQEGLVEFDRALAAVREYLETIGLAARAMLPEIFLESEKLETPDGLTPIGQVAHETPAPRRGRRVMAWLLWLVVFLTGETGVVWLFFNNEEDKRLRIQERVTFLESEGFRYVENRRWQEAARSFAEIETLVPGSDLAVLGRRSIESGMDDEQNQFVGYWTGQAIAELEADRIDEAEAAIQKVIEKFPYETEAGVVQRKISVARAGQSREAAIAAARRQLNARQWQAAITSARRILLSRKDDPDATMILADATDALEKFNADQSKARELLEKAISRDQGQFDHEALAWLREAALLAPDNQEIRAHLEKMSSYTRTLRVPDDYATPAAALAAARENDRIVLAEKTWRGPLVISVSLELQGAGSNKTLVESAADDGCAITIAPQAKKVRISGISFRHDSFQAVGADRFSAALVRGGNADFIDCHFRDASGHGLAVIEGGVVSANRCHFNDNGWNGAAAIGKGSSLEIRDSECLNNFEHGIESWQGASVFLTNNRCEGNSRNGIHCDNGAASATIEGNQLNANREFGLVLNSAASGKITGNTARSNLLGGLVICKAAANLRVTANQATQNYGPGLVLEKGLSAASYAENSFTKNATQDIFQDADFSLPQEQ